MFREETGFQILTPKEVPALRESFLLLNMQSEIIILISKHAIFDIQLWVEHKRNFSRF